MRRRGLTDDGRARLRAAALANRPWLLSSGPKTIEGKRKSAANGKLAQKGEMSVRERRAELAEFRDLIRKMQGCRGRLMGETDPGPSA